MPRAPLRLPQLAARLLLPTLALLLVAGPGSARAGEGEAEPARLTLVHFWATWCTPCLAELQSLAAFYEGTYPELAARGVALEVVSNDVRPDDLSDFLARQWLPFPVVLDSLGERSSSLGVQGLPGTVLVDAEGSVRERILGPLDWSSPGLLASIEAHLSAEETVAGRSGAELEE